LTDLHFARLKSAFLFWPDLDVHLGWTRLRQLVDPNAALEVSRIRPELDWRCGMAAKKACERAEVKPK
jgi:hypothetical protein